MQFFNRSLAGLFAFCAVFCFGHSDLRSQERGLQKRHGDEIMVCGQLYRIGTPVKLWLDPGGFDAYRTDRRFSSLEERKWSRIVEDMKSGKVDFVTKPQEVNPDRYGCSATLLFSGIRSNPRWRLEHRSTTEEG